MKIVQPALDILKEYREAKGYFVLPWLRVLPDPRLTVLQNRINLTEEIKNRTSTINFHLKALAKKAGIKKNISTHIARHTFAMLGDEKLGGNLKKLQSLLNHGSRKMTEIYIGELRQTKSMDDDADKIFE